MVAAKKNNDIRICIDPKDLNCALMHPHYLMRTLEDVAACMAGAKLFSTLNTKSGFWQVKLDDAFSLCNHSQQSIWTILFFTHAFWNQPSF